MNAGEVYQGILAEMKKHVAGKVDVVELMLIALIANGHTLLEGVPGVAKTTITKTLANCIQADFKRIQGTSDLEPRDIIGYTYLDVDNSVKFNKGPIFTNILLVDELNRMHPKTMSALLETLEERQASVGGQPMRLPNPFITFATQNPLRVEGTEPLPKVLSDRFLLKIEVDYPSMKEEREMLEIKENEQVTTPKKIITTDDVITMQEQAKRVELPGDVAEYITKVVTATRNDLHIVMGASPRADLAFMWCGKAKALIEGRNKVGKEDIKFLAKSVLSHRIAVRASGGIGVRGIIDGIIATLD